MILAAAALMVTVTACNKSDEQETQPQGVSFSLTFEGTTSPKTRVAFEDEALTGVWEADDIVYVYLNATGGKTYGPYEATPDGAGERASFTAKITGVDAGIKIAGIDAYHYDNLDHETPNNRNYNGTITYSLPASNSGTFSYLTVSSYDYPSGSEPEATEGGNIDINEVLTFNQSLARLDIKTDLSIKEISLSLIDAKFPTSASLDIANGKTTATKSASMISINPAVDNYYQIGLIPVDFGGSKTMRATVFTTSGEAYAREVTVSAFEKAKRYTLDLSKTAMKTVITIKPEDGFKPIQDKPAGNFVLTDDLTLTEIPHLIGFSGTLDGNGHTIDITAAGPTNNEYGGIFSTTTGNASVTNITVIAGDRSADIVEGGIIAGRVEDGATLTLNNVHAEGNIAADRRRSTDKHLFVGGLVGCVPKDSKIHATNCSFKGNVTADQSLVDITKNSYVGGIVGAVETSGDFTTGEQYIGINDSNDSYIINCKFSGTLTNTAYYASGHEIYTGGIAGRCTGLIKDCSVTDVTIEAEESSDGSGIQAKPILGNDWYEYVYNDNNSYTNVTINGKSPRTGIYKGSKAAGTEKPYYSDQK